MLTRNQHIQVTLPACCISYANPEKSSKTDLFSDFLYASFRDLLNYMNKKKKATHWKTPFNQCTTGQTSPRDTGESWGELFTKQMR